jgi:glucan phosphoethanolaminetransferase (alkaline phosphatase superfamily)
MKRGLIWGILSSFLALTGFASAAFFSDTLSFIDPTLITLAVLFVVLFAVLYFATSKIFKGQTKIAAVISIALALLAVYWINLSFSLGQLFSGFGISNDNLYTFGSILFIALTIFLAIKLKFGVLLIIGGIMILAGVTNLVYSTDIVIIIGIVLVVIGVVLWIKKKGKGKGSTQELVAEEGKIRNKIGREKTEIPKERDMAARARAMAIADADYAREQARRKAGEKNKIAQEQQQEHGLQNQVGDYLVSLRQSYNQLQEDYNALLKINPQDPKIREIYNELSAVRSEMQRVMTNNKIRYKD